MSDTVFSRLERWLIERSIPFDVLRHAPVFTSAEAAAARGTSLGSGAKALICKADDALLMLVMPADRRLDSKGLRKREGWKSLRFAEKAEVLELTGLEPGSIPPFGSLFGLATWCDERLADNERINFNAGDHTISISMRYADFLAAEAPRVAWVAERAE